MSPALLRMFQGVAAAGRLGLGYTHRGSRYAARVPAGERFFSSPLKGIGRSARLAFNPNLGYLNYGKPLLTIPVIQGIASSIQAAEGKARKLAEQLPDSRSKALVLQDFKGDFLPSLRVAGELAGLPTMGSLDGLPAYYRGQLRQESRKGLLAGTREWADANRHYHPQGWLEKKWQEPIKTVTQPANKLLAEGLYRGLDALPDAWYPQLPNRMR